MSDLLVYLILAIAAEGSPQTIYHDRIDGLLMPFSDLPARGQYWGFL